MKSLIPSLFLFFSLLSFQVASAQSFVIKGAVTDTMNANRLQYSSITLIRAADSILEAFTRTKEDGSFELKPNNEGKYIFMATFPGFADYVDIVNLSKEKPVLDMGVIPMVSKAHLLSEFVLKQQLGSIKIKGDTIEYVADSFITREGATVEELLKKLPGLQVSKTGEVIAQGEKVQKILVDGEEFFTDDPAVVTKSLQAKAVDKVQVFDKKSDQAEFTGIDDGVREKTINLQLKDNMKKGYFGKIDVGGGTDGFFENQGMINAFKGKRKFAAFGIAANTGKIGLNWEDRDKFGGGNNNTFIDEDGARVSFYSSDDEESWGGQWDGQGLPAAWTGGLHYSNKWHNDDLHLSSNYRYAKQNIETIGNTITQYNLPGLQYYTNESNESFKTGQRNRVDGLFEWKLDSTSTLKITANSGYSNTITNTDFRSNSFDTSGIELNNNRRFTTNDATSKSLNSTLSYRKKFAKKGRTFSLTMDEGYRETESDGKLNSATLVFNDLIPPDTTEINQGKKNDSKNFQLNGNVSFTEPISKTMFLEVNYGLTVNNSYSRRLSLNMGIPESDPNHIDSLFSSDYDFDVLTNKGGANLRFVFKKVNFSFGGAISGTDFKQKDIFTSREFNRNFTNYFPRASFTYRPAQQKTISINYNGSTRQPSIDQIQPLRQNTDPLNISEGNEELKQEFNHDISFRYNNYKVLTGTYTYLGGGFTLVDNDISRSENIISGVRRFQYINVDGNYNGYSYGGFGKQIRKLDLRVGVDGNINVSKTNTFVNGVRNENVNNSFSVGPRINYDKEDKFDIALSSRPSYNNNTSSINNTSTNYWTINNNLDAEVELPWKIDIGTEVSWQVRQRVGEFDRNNNVVLWNAFISKKLLKGDQLVITAKVNDILNQNINFSRFGSNGILTERTNNTIRRYGMISIAWNFTKSPSGTPKADDGGTGIIIKK